MTSEPHAHVWSAGPSYLARYCQACFLPMIPSGAVRWWDRIEEFRGRQDCTAELEDIAVAEELATAANGDTMPAQGWAELPEGFKRHPYCSPLNLPVHAAEPFEPNSPRILGAAITHAYVDEIASYTYPDAGRNPATREEHTMASLIAQAEVREDFGHAADRASTIAEFATMTAEQRLEELERRPIRDLRDLHQQAAANEAWHQQGANDSRQLTQVIGQLLRSVGDEIAPQNATEADSIGVLR